MVVNTESVVGYNNKLKKATTFMRIGVNSDLNIPVRRSAPKHNLGSRAVKLPHSGVETRVVKSETKEKQVAKSKTSDRDAVGRSPEFGDRESGDSGAGLTKENKDCFNFARDQFECFDYCRRRVSLVSFKMTFDLL